MSLDQTAGNREKMRMRFDGIMLSSKYKGKVALTNMFSVSEIDSETGGNALCTTGPKSKSKLTCG